MSVKKSTDLVPSSHVTGGETGPGRGDMAQWRRLVSLLPGRVQQVACGQAVGAGRALAISPPMLHVENSAERREVTLPRAKTRTLLFLASLPPTKSFHTGI